MLRTETIAGQKRFAAFCALFLGCSLALHVQADPADSGIVISDKTDTAINFARQETPYNAEHRAAVKQARAGDVKAGLATLDRLHRDHPNNLGVARDYIVVLGWAGKHKDSIDVYRAMPPIKQPDYVIESVARSYRITKRPAEALTLYQQGKTQSPNNPSFPAGEIRSLADSKHADQAIIQAEEYLKKKGDKVEVLLAAAYAAKIKKAPVDAVRYCERALRISPGSREARHDLILAMADMGSPQVALRMAKENPGTLSQAEIRRLEGDKTAASVRWSPHEPASEADRFVATDRTIAELDKHIAGWSALGQPAHGDLLRARFDRMVAWHDRSRMQEVIAEYEQLQKDNVTVPPYAMLAAGDAYLYKHQPEKARDLYNKVLESEPKNFNARLQLFYAYVELNDFKAAYKQIDDLNSDTGVWIYLKGLPEPLPNAEREYAELAAGYARLYGEDYIEAERRIAALADAAPNNARYRAALGTLYEARGWPRRAQEQFQIGVASMNGRDVWNEAGEARTNLDLLRFKEAEAKTDDLVARFPENLEVQRLDRLRKVHNKAKIILDVGHAFRSATAASGGDGTSVEGTVFSPPIFNSWRLFAGERFAIEKEPGAEGSIMLLRSTAGVEFRRNQVTLSIAPTYNLYDDVRNKDTQRIGVRGEAKWSISDQWEIGGNGEMFSRNTPLRALNSGVTADAGNVYAYFRQNERREVRVDGVAMHYSDGNWHSGGSIDYAERIYTSPLFKIDGLILLAESQNSHDANRLYYNPRQDVLALGGARLTHTLYRRNQFAWEHSLAAKPGIYWQRFHGTNSAVAASYEHSVRSNDVFEAKVGANFSRQDFDGTTEDNVNLLLNLIYRF